MDARTCLKKLQYVGVLAFATVDNRGNPQVRNISAIHYEPDAIYFFTARGKDFCRELLSDGRVQVLGYTKYKEMIRLSAKAVPVPQVEQENGWILFLRSSPICPTYTRARPGGLAWSLRFGRPKLNIFTSGFGPSSARATRWGRQGLRPGDIGLRTPALDAELAPAIVRKIVFFRAQSTKFSRNTACIAATALNIVRPARFKGWRMTARRGKNMVMHSQTIMFLAPGKLFLSGITQYRV